MWHVTLFYVATTCTCVYAFRLGDLEERACAWIMIFATASTWLVASEARRRFHTPELGIMVVDIMMFGALVYIALRTTRFWPLWIAGIQGYALAAHFARLLTIHVAPLMYAIGQGLMSYPMMLILVAAIRYRRRISINS